VKHVISLVQEADSLLNKWKAEAVRIRLVYVGPDKEVQFSFVGRIEEVDLPSVWLVLLGSPVCEIYVGLSVRDI
jgi:hypothetical protein